MNNEIIRTQINFFKNERDNLVRSKKLKFMKLLGSEIVKIDNEIHQYNQMINHLKSLL